MRSVFDRRVGIVVVALCVSCTAQRRIDTGARSSREVITQEQLSEHQFHNVLEALQALRSNWLQAKGPDSFNKPSQVQVYLDDTRLGGVETLRQIQPSTVSYIRHFDGVTATARWGLDHGQGVIYVSTRSSPRSSGAEDTR